MDIPYAPVQFRSGATSTSTHENFPTWRFCIRKFSIGRSGTTSKTGMVHREFHYGEILHREIPYKESGATSKTGLALGFCGDIFSASPWGGEFAVGKNV